MIIFYRGKFNMLKTLPKDFMFGGATAAYQAEGATKEVITPDRIEKAYGIRAAIHNLEDRWIVLPEKSS